MWSAPYKEPTLKELLISLGEHDVSLDLDGASESNGWRAEDMFKANEDQYGVTSSFKSNLDGYTMQLSTDRDSDKYR